MPIPEPFYKNIVQNSPSFNIFDQNQYFSEASYIPLHNYNSEYDAPPPKILMGGVVHSFIYLTQTFLQKHCAVAIMLTFQNLSYLL